MTDSELKALLDGFDAHRKCLVWELNAWTWLVAFGVVCEIIFIIWDHIVDLQEWRESRTHGRIPFPSRPSRVKLIFEIASVIFVVAGIVGELHIEAQLGDLDNRIQDANNKRVALLQQQTEHERLLRVQLENRIVDAFGYRTLTPEESAGMAKKLIGLTGVQVDVLVVDFIDAPSSDKFKDSVNMGRSIRDSLNAANLDAEGWVVESCLGGSGAQGMTVAVHSGALAMDQYMAGKILAAFPPALGFVNIVENWDPTSYCKAYSDLLPAGKPNKRLPGTAKIMVAIGPKTQPILTREMLEPDQPKR